MPVNLSNITVGGFPATEEQKVVLNKAITAMNQSVHMKIIAGAGCSKTSTLVALSGLVNKSALYLAFNKTIAAEAGKIFAGVTCRTVNSLAFKYVGKDYKDRLTGKVLPQTVISEATAAGDPIDPYDIYEVDQITAMALTSFTNFCQSSDKRFGIQHLPGIREFEDLTNLPNNPHLFFLARKVLSLAAFIWKRMSDLDSKFEVTHEFYLKRWALSEPQLPFQYIMVDEYQDTNDVIVDLLQKQKSTVLYIGDPRQSIYQWRGAIGAMDKTRTPVTGVLSTSFRFNHNIARMANAVLKEFLNCEFRVHGGSPFADRISVEPVRRPDAILCRSNATAMRCAMNLLKKGIAVNLIVDKDDIARSIKAVDMINSGQRSSHPEIGLFSSMEELQAYAMTPQGASIRGLLRMYSEFGVKKLIDLIKKLDDAGDGAVTIVTAHKAKGMEFDTVVIERDFVTPPDERFSEEEGNLLYVAITRAKKVLDISQHEGLKDLWRYVNLNPARAAV